MKMHLSYRFQGPICYFAGTFFPILQIIPKTSAIFFKSNFTTPRVILKFTDSTEYFHISELLSEFDLFSTLRDFLFEIVNEEACFPRESNRLAKSTLINCDENSWTSFKYWQAPMKTNETEKQLTAHTYAWLRS